jgi:hypothetical protein
MANEIVVSNTFLAPSASLDTVLMAYQAKKDFIEKVLRQGVDYGVIPGGNKPALLKPGAEKMVSFFGLSPIFEDVLTVEDWTGKDHDGEPFFYYRQRCVLHSGQRVIGSADGSCNSWEKKYRYRSSERVCPKCGKATIIKGKQEYGGGFICFAKKGGCGAKFADNDPTIIGQEVGTIKNPDIAEVVNTILKMAQKRALVASVLISTGASDYFTQDMEDFIDAAFEPATEQHKTEQQKQPPLTPLEKAKAMKTPGGKLFGELSVEQLNTLIERGTAEMKAAAQLILDNMASGDDWTLLYGLLEKADQAGLTFPEVSENATKQQVVDEIEKIKAALPDAHA